MSVRWQHCIDHADKINIQKPGESPDCLLGVVPQPTDSRLSETTLAGPWLVIRRRVAGFLLQLQFSFVRAECDETGLFTSEAFSGCLYIYLYIYVKLLRAILFIRALYK